MCTLPLIEVIASTKENARKCSIMRLGFYIRSGRLGLARKGARRALLANYNLAERAGGEETRNVGHIHRRIESFRPHFAEKGLQALKARLGHDTTLVEFGFGQVAPRLLDDLAS